MLPQNGEITRRQFSIPFVTIPFISKSLLFNRHWVKYEHGSGVSHWIYFQGKETLGFVIHHYDGIINGVIINPYRDIFFNSINDAKYWVERNA